MPALTEAHSGCTHITLSCGAPRENEASMPILACGPLSTVGSTPYRPVAALDGLKNENFCCDHNILINPTAKCPSAILSATVHPLSVSDAEELSLKPREALERRKCRPLTTRAEHALREVDLAIVLGRHMQQSDGSHFTTACTTIECNGPRLV